MVTKRTALVSTFGAALSDRAYMRWAAAFLTLNAVDAITTIAGLSHGIHENNPLFTTPASVIVVKALGVLAICALLAAWQSYAQRRQLPPSHSGTLIRTLYALPRSVLPLSCTILILVVASNLVHLAVGY